MAAASLFLLTLLGLSSLASSSDQQTTICKAAPHWSIGDEVPMQHLYGRVTVVALLQASCGFCLVQAASMGPLRDKLENQGLTNISYIIVNDQSSLSRILHPKLEKQAPPGVPVYLQGPNQDDVWEILDGNKDDFLVYDRCGRLTFHIRLPYSYLHFPYVEAAINTTYYEDHCQNCSFYANVTWNAKSDASLENVVKGKTEVLGKDKIASHEDGKYGERHKESTGAEAGEHKPHHPTNDKGDTNKAHQPTKTKGKVHEKSHRPSHSDGP